MTTTFHLQGRGERGRGHCDACLPDLAEVERLHVECFVHAAVAEDDGRVQLVEQPLVRDYRLQAGEDLFKNIRWVK